jgi:hypothetical protein
LGGFTDAVSGSYGYPDWRTRYSEVRLHIVTYLQTNVEISCNSVLLMTPVVWLKISAKSKPFHPVIQTIHVMKFVE